MSMKALFFITSLLTLVSCHSPKVAVIPQRRYYSFAMSNDIKSKEYFDSLAEVQSDLKLLKFLKTQPKEVTEAFKRDFILTPDQLNHFIDSIKVFK